MRLEVTLFVPLCLFLSLCNGASPKEDMDLKNKKYTDEEDKFIIENISSLLDEYKGLDSRILWVKLAEKHNEMYQKGISGFYCERSSLGLRSRFKNTLIRHHLSKKRALPDSLVQQLILQHQKKRKRGNKTLCPHSYSTQEDDLIFKELLKPSCTNKYGFSTLHQIQAKLNEKHKAKTLGFENKRTVPSLRSHLFSMRDKHQLPYEVEKKFSKLQEDVDNNDPTSKSQQTNLQVTDEWEENTCQENVWQENDDWVREMVIELENNTDYDIDFSKLGQCGDK